MSHLAPGARLGADLTLRRLLGKGGLGEAWLAHDARHGEVVAKVLPPDAPAERVALLERESRLTGALDHPAIVAIYGFGRDAERAWLTLEWVPGGDARRLRGAPPVEVLRALLPVVEALAHAHARGVVHRDVKASNVLLGADGRGRLADFGLAAPLTTGPAEEALVGGGSRYSVSPQQLDGAPPHPADDVYGLGVLLYELIQGWPPFWPDIDAEKIRNAAPPPLRPPTTLPDRLAELVATMLAKPRAARPGLDKVREVMASALQELEAVAGRAPAAGIVATPAGVPAPPAMGGPPPPAPPPRGRRDVVLQPPPRFEALVAPVPQPADARAPSAAPRAVARRTGLASALILTSLAAAALFVFLYLPRLVARTPSAPQETLAAEPPASGGVTVGADTSGGAGARQPVEAEATDASGREARPRPAAPVEADAAPGAAGRGADAVAPTASAASDRRSAAPRPMPASAIRAGEPATAPAPASREAEAAFAAAVGEGLAALERGAFAEARDAFARAGALRPGAAAVADGLARAEEGLRIEAIAGHRARAAVHEAREEWPAALTEHQAALALDPTLAFAQAGRARAEQRAALDAQLAAYLQRPERLAAAAVAAEAAAVLEHAREVPDPGPRLRAQTAALERRLREATTPVSVRLVSDGKTDVAILRVGRLGAFKEKQLELLPGTYAVVGTRPGYRDARRTLEVKAGAPPPPLEVRCVEAL